MQVAAALLVEMEVEVAAREVVWEGDVAWVAGEEEAWVVQGLWEEVEVEARVFQQIPTGWPLSRMMLTGTNSGWRRDKRCQVSGVRYQVSKKRFQTTQI